MPLSSLDCYLFLHILNATNQRKCRHGNRFKKQQITTNRLKSAIELIGELEKVKEEGEIQPVLWSPQSKAKSNVASASKPRS
jgi:hypothetical protein